MKPISWFHLYKILIRTSIRSRMQYKFNFVLGAILAALIQISEFLMVALVLHKFGAIKGWSLHEIGYLFAIMTLSKTLYRTFGNEVHHLEKYLVGGELDQLLTRPMPVLLALMPQNFRIMIGEVLQGGFILCWSLAGMMHSGQIGWTVVPLSLFVIVTGAIILFPSDSLQPHLVSGRHVLKSYKSSQRMRPVPRLNIRSPSIPNGCPVFC